MPPLHQSLAIDDKKLAAFWVTKSFETQTPGILTKEPAVFESLPAIQKWMNRRGRYGHLTEVQAILDICETSPRWLQCALEEINHVVPVGNATRAIWELCKAIMQYFASKEKENSPGAKQAIGLMRRMINEEDCSDFKVTSILYTLAMRADPTAADKLFETLLTRYKQNSTRCKPSVSNRVALVVALTKSGKASRAAQLLWSGAPLSLYNVVLSSLTSPEDADKLLLLMESHIYQEKGTKPNLRSFRLVLRKWTAVDPIRGQGILERAIVWSSKSSPELRPPVEMFLEVMKAHGDSAEAVEYLLSRLASYLETVSDAQCVKAGFLLTSEPYEICIAAWIRKGNPERAEKILSDMLSTSIQPTSNCWRLLAKSWTELGDFDRADGIVQQAGTSADVGLCNIVLKGRAQRDAERAESYLEWMRQQSKVMHPNEESYKLVFSAWKRSESKHAYRRFKNLQQRMEKHAAGERTQSSSEVNKSPKRILGIAKKNLPALKFLKLPQAGQQQVQKGQSAPPLTSENCKDAVSSLSGSTVAEEIFRRMKDAAIRPTSVSLKCVIAGLNPTIGLEAPPTTRSVLKRLENGHVPDAESCNSVLAICLSETSSQASVTSRSMLSHMMREYASGNQDMRPKAATFRRLFARLYTERSKISPKAAFGMVMGMEFPDEQFEYSCFVYALTVCAWSRDGGSPKYAHLLWQRLENPSLECFNLVLKSFAEHPKHETSRKAQDLLQSTENRADWTPNAQSFNLVIEAVAKSRRDNAAQQSFCMLQRYQSRIADTSSLTHVLLACAMTPSSDKGSRLHHFNLATRAVTCWKERGGRINSLHYLRLLTCAIRLAPNSKSRLSMALKVFEDCCADGLVDTFVLRRFWGLAPPMTRSDLLGRYVLKPTIKDLPNEWVCNVSRSPRQKI